MKTSLAILIPLVLVGCWLPDIRLKRNVTHKEIVGVWTMTQDSFRDIKTDSDASDIQGSHKDYQIEIWEDGTVRYRSLLQMPTRTVDYRGTWQLKPQADSAKGNRLHMLLEADGTYGVSLDFTEQDGKLLLWTYFGDPDSWRLEQYEK
jgi:hypothetical protein